MFDFGVGYSEMFLIAVVAIIVIGPKDLPRVLRAFGKSMAKMRGMAREFQGHLDGALKDAGLEDIKKEIQGLKNIGTIDPAAKKPPVDDKKRAEDDFKKFFGEAETASNETRPAA